MKTITLEKLFEDTEPNLNAVTKTGPFCDLLGLVCEEYVLRECVPELTRAERTEIAKWATVCHIAAGIEEVSLGRPKEPEALAKVLLKPGRRIIIERLGGGVVESYDLFMEKSGRLRRRPVVKLDRGHHVYPELKEIIGVE